MPNVILEALLMRVPVVATNVGGTGEVVSDGVSGRLIPPNDVEALASAMREALGEASGLASWVDAGERHVRGKFSHAARVPRIAAVYDRVLGLRGGVAATQSVAA
jgi:glycosyltransferase involved in cell wall biosynthesis